MNASYCKLNACHLTVNLEENCCWIACSNFTQMQRCIHSIDSHSDKQFGQCFKKELVKRRFSQKQKKHVKSNLDSVLLKSMPSYSESTEHWAAPTVDKTRLHVSAATRSLLTPREFILKSFLFCLSITSPCYITHIHPTTTAMPRLTSMPVLSLTSSKTSVGQLLFPTIPRCR